MNHFYCYRCHAIVTAEAVPAHRKELHDVDETPQEFYQEMERDGVTGADWARANKAFRKAL